MSENVFREDEYEIYKKKREEFFRAVRVYKEDNKKAIYNNKCKLDSHSDEILRYYSECERNSDFGSSECHQGLPKLHGLLIRKRTVRHIHKENDENVNVCNLEPWFKRFLRLCKFIYAARIIIYKNRLIKNLVVLRQLDEDNIDLYERNHITCDNVSYPHVFKKFI